MPVGVFIGDAVLGDEGNVKVGILGLLGDKWGGNAFADFTGDFVLLLGVSGTSTSMASSSASSVATLGVAAGPGVFLGVSLDGSSRFGPCCHGFLGETTGNGLMGEPGLDDDAFVGEAGLEVVAFVGLSISINLDDLRGVIGSSTDVLPAFLGDFVGDDGLEGNSRSGALRGDADVARLLGDANFVASETLLRISRHRLLRFDRRLVNFLHGRPYCSAKISVSGICFNCLHKVGQHSATDRTWNELTPPALHSQKYMTQTNSLLSFSHLAALLSSPSTSFKNPPSTPL